MKVPLTTITFRSGFLLYLGREAWKTNVSINSLASLLYVWNNDICALSLGVWELVNVLTIRSVRNPRNTGLLCQIVVGRRRLLPGGLEAHSSQKQGQLSSFSTSGLAMEAARTIAIAKMAARAPEESRCQIWSDNNLFEWQYWPEDLTIVLRRMINVDEALVEKKPLYYIISKGVNVEK